MEKALLTFRKNKLFVFYLCILAVVVFYPIDTQADYIPASNLENGLVTRSDSIVNPGSLSISGSATYSIPIELPPGGVNMEPHIALNYSSSNNKINGAVGVGWDLGLDCIRRSTKFGLDYQVDKFVAQGGSMDLVPRKIFGQAPDQKFFGAKIESEYTRYQFIEGNSSGNDVSYWLVTYANGIKKYYGRDSQEDIFESKQEFANEKSNTKEVFAWYLDSVEDTYGNKIKYNYAKDSGQIYITSIIYGGNESKLFKITFEYDTSSRSENTNLTYCDYKTHHKTITKWRLRNIIISKNKEEITTNDYIKRYNISYIAGLSRLSMIQSVSLYGSGDVKSNKVYSFKYSEASPAIDYTTDQNVTSIEKGVELPTSLKNYLNFADIDGNGSSDLVIRKTTGGIKLTTYFSKYISGEDTTKTPFDFTPKYPNIKFGDIDGDGKHEMISYDNSGNVLLYRAGTKSYTTINTNGTSSNVGVLSGSISDIVMADTNGDGKAELLKITHANNCIQIDTFQGLSDGTLKKINHVAFTVPSNYESLIKSNIFADYNGDGRIDFAFAVGFNWLVFLAKNDGSYDSGTGVSNRIPFDSKSSISNVDVNGDGLTDIVLNKEISDENGKKIKAVCYFSRGNGLFTNTNTGKKSDGSSDEDGYIALSETEWQDSEHKQYERQIVVCDFRGSGVVEGRRYVRYVDNLVYLADINGDGLQDVIRTENPIKDVRDSGIRIQLSNKNNKPTPSNILETAYYGIGGLGAKKGVTTDYNYLPSSRYANCYLPFVTHVVDSVTIHDGFNSATTKYSYLYGLYDVKTRDFKGFGYAGQINPDQTTQGIYYYSYPEAGLSNWLNQDECYKGRPWIIRKNAGKVYEKTDLTWNNKVSDIANASDLSRFVTLDKKKTVFNSDSSTFIDEVFEYYGYDSSKLGDGAPGAIKKRTLTGTAMNSQSKEYAYSYFTSMGLWKQDSEILKETVGTNLIKIRDTKYDWEVVNNRFLKTSSLQTNHDKNNNLQASPVVISEFNVYGQLVNQGVKQGVIENNVYNEDWIMPDDVTETNYGLLTSPFPSFVKKPDTTITGKATPVIHKVGFESYNPINGKPETIIDENTSNKTYYGFDAFGRLVKVDAPDTEIIATEYGDSLFPSYISKYAGTDKTAIISREYYDGLGRLIQSVRPMKTSTGKWSVTLYSYDNMGRLKHTVGPFATSVFSYQETDYPNLVSGIEANVNKVLSNRQKTINYYDTQGRISYVNDSKNGNKNYYYIGVTNCYSCANTSIPVTIVESGTYGSTRTEKRDALGRIIEIVEKCASKDKDDKCSGDQATYYTYNAAGDLTSVKRTDPKTASVIENKMLYNTLGQKEEMTDPDLGRYTYQYDIKGNLTKQMRHISAADSGTEWQIMKYDELNRITSKTYHHAVPVPGNYAVENPTVTWTYDDGTITPLNPIGRLSKVSNGNVEYKVTDYDGVGRIRGEEKTIQGFTAGTSKKETFEYTYNDYGGLASITYPGYNVSYKYYYPGSGLIEAVTGTGGTKLAEITEYTPSGKIAKISYGNSVQTNYNYDLNSDRLSNLKTAGDNGVGSRLQDYDYGYSGAGDITSITDNINELGRVFMYDNMHRLTDEVKTDYGTTNETLDYVYSYTGTGGVHNVKKITTGGKDYSFGYDTSGNMTSSPDLRPTGSLGTRTLSYNADNMPLSVRVGNSDTLFRYDGIAKRAAKRVGTGTDTFYYNNLYEIINGVKTRYVFAGNLRIARITGEATVDDIAFIHQDHLGSTTVITDIDGERVNYDAIRYTPFGLETNGQTQLGSLNYRFTDQERDSSTGLYNYDARLYDPAIGLFVCGDSIVPDMYDPQSLNRYSYCRNNPLGYVDPSGNYDISTGCVEPGDNLADITFDLNFYYGTNFSIGEIAKANNISNIDLIYVDQTIRIGTFDSNSGKIWSPPINPNIISENYFYSLNESQQQILHYHRNIYQSNANIPLSLDEVNMNEWDYKGIAIAHNLAGASGNVDLRGVGDRLHQQAIYGPDRLLVNSPENMGTYDFASPKGPISFFEHRALDIRPWIQWGNTPRDQTTQEERLNSVPWIAR